MLTADPAEAVRFAERWSRSLVWELATIQGLFAGAVIVAVRRRQRAILALAAAVLLKFLVHALISPVGRLVVPAVALELLAISLCLAEWPRSSRRQRVAFGAFALAFAAALTLAVPPMEAFVLRRDSRVLPGVQSFSLRIEGGGLAQCRLERGAIMGMGPKWVALGIATHNHTAQATAKLVEQAGGRVCGLGFVIELDFLKGRDKLPGRDIQALVHY